MSKPQSKAILISHISLPYSGIGSWTMLYNYYLTTEDHQIDYIICPEDTDLKDKKGYVFSDNLKPHEKVIKRLIKKRYLGVFKALKKILKTDENYIIKLIDNPGIGNPLHHLLLKLGLRKQCYIQLYYHGYPPYFGNLKGGQLFQSLDELILLTKDSYRAHLNYYTQMPCLVSILPNGIDTTVFKPAQTEEKTQLRRQFEIDDNTCVFLWLSQDRPKKGLDFILPIWRQFHKKNPETQLWVIGSEKNLKGEGIRSLGRLPNTDLPNYYKAADVYLYPILNKEGFGLSLIEALHCGCYCIASKNGGVPEVLNYGKYGVLVENPNFVNEWILEMEKSYSLFEHQTLDGFFKIPEDLYALETWSHNLNDIISKAKNRLAFE